MNITSCCVSVEFI